MDLETLDFITQCADIQKQPFFYFKDKYALDLLKFSLKGKKTVNELKKSKLGHLLEKPVVKELYAKTGKKEISNDDLQSHWPPHFQVFKLSIGKWEARWKEWGQGWEQTSRPGYNLVLQLNFSRSHDRVYNQLIGADEDDSPFTCYAHPTSEERNTMSWSRIDIDFKWGEAIIEEIQNDWLRFVEENYNDAKAGDDWFFNHNNCNMRTFTRYYELMKPYQDTWQEATMSAALNFIRNELGIHKIFYHTYDAGNYIKCIKGNKRPPRSIYTQLPKRFGFEVTDEVPTFLRRERVLQKFWKQNREAGLKWFVLEI